MIYLIVWYCSLKVLSEIISIYMVDEEDWTMLAKLEDRSGNGGNEDIFCVHVVARVILALIEKTKALRIESLYFPVFCRACEKVGRFLWRR